MTIIDSSEAVTTSDVVCFETFSTHRNDLLSAQKVVTATLLVITIITVIIVLSSKKGNIFLFSANQRPRDSSSDQSEAR